MQVGDDDRVDVDVVADARAACENTPLPQSSSSGGPVLLDEVAAAGAAGVLPGRRLAQHRDAQPVPPSRGRQTHDRPRWETLTACSARCPSPSGRSAFDESALVLGGLLWSARWLAGVAHRSFLSLTALFVVAGFAARATAGSAWSTSRPRSTFVDELAIVALIVILFRDGLEVEAEMLQRAWHLPLRKLVLAMPLTARDRRARGAGC